MVLVQKEDLREVQKEVKREVVRVSNTTFTPFCEVIKIGEIIIMDKTKADNLLSLGFKYITRNIDNKEVFVFIQTNELMQELNSKFEQGSFFIGKTLNF